MKVGIVILNYNDANQTIDFVNTLNSFQNKHTICIVDNHSKDDSYQKLKKLKKRNVKVIALEKNVGYAAGNNVGLKYLNQNECDTFIIANPDILIEEHALNDFIAYIQAYPQYGIFGPTIEEKGSINHGWKLMKINYDIIDNLVYINRLFKHRKQYKHTKYKGILNDVDVVSGCFFAMTKEVIDKIGFLDEETFLYYEENILAHKAKLEGIKTCVLNPVVIQHNHSVTIDKNINRYQKLKVQKDSQYYYRSLEKHSKIAMWLLKRTGDIACHVAKLRTKNPLEVKTRKTRKVTLLSLHMQVGGIEKAICSIANMLVEKYDVEIINVYHLVETIPFVLDSRVKVKYLSMTLQPNKAEFNQAMKNKKILKIIKEGCKAVWILDKKRKLIKVAAKECDGDIIVSTTLAFNKAFAHYQKNKVLVAWEHCHPSRSKNYIKQVKKAVKNFDFFIPASKELYNYYNEIVTGPKCVYVPLCIDNLPKQKAMLKTNHITVMGRLSKEKGYDDMLRVIKQIVVETPVHLDILGEGDQWRELQALMRELDLESYVTFHGNVTGSKKEKLLLNTSVFVTTSHYESFGLVLLEAMSYGIPCVSFDSARGSLEIIEDGKNGYLVPNRNLNEMAQKIVKLLQKTTKVMCENAIKTAKQYHYPIVKKQWLETFATLELKNIKTRVIFTSSAGGHYSELNELDILMDTYNSFLLTEDHPMMMQQKKTNKARTWYLRPGTKEHLVKFLWNFPFNIVKSFNVYKKVKPDIVIATGAHTTVPICYIAKLFGKKVIFIETFANITTKTLSGKLVYPIADLFLVQWPEMLELYPKAKYKGGLK